MQRVLLTGATGFLGNEILKHFADRNDLEFVLLVRKFEVTLSKFNQITYKEYYFSPNTYKVDAIVHCAGLAHTSLPHSFNSKRRYVTDNIKLTRDIVHSAHIASVQRFIFVSTINVHTFHDGVVSEQSKLVGNDLYSASKIKCENIVRNTLEHTKTSSIILRPSVMYGTDSLFTKGNIGKLKSFMYRYRFMIVPSNSGTQNYTSTENFCSFLEHVLLRPYIKDEKFIITDEVPITLYELILRLSKNNKSRILILIIPKLFFKFLLTTGGLRSQFAKISRNLHTSVAKAKSYGWVPKN